MTQDKTFQAITQLLADGAWHTLDDLRQATAFPAEWVKELEADGTIEVQQQVGTTLVRLRPSTNGT